MNRDKLLIDRYFDAYALDLENLPEFQRALLIMAKEAQELYLYLLREEEKED